MKAIVVYRGPASGGDYQGDIVAVVYRSGNSKTGSVAGLVIAPDDGEGNPIPYWTQRRSGADAAVCGACPMRPATVAVAIEAWIKGGRIGPKPVTCYVGDGSSVGSGIHGAALKTWRGLPVTKAKAVRSFLRSLRRGGASALRSAVHGDAAALPAKVWAMLEHACAESGLPILGYTHAKLDTVPHLRATHAASVATIAGADAARAQGWHYFGVVQAGTLPRRGEFACPASAERGHKVQCNDCLACGSVGIARSTRSAIIWRHDGAGQAARRRLESLSIAA